MSRRKHTTTVQPLYYTIQDVCTLLGLGRTMVYTLMSKERLPRVKFGTATRIPVDKFEQWRAQRSAV